MSTLLHPRIAEVTERIFDGLKTETRDANPRARADPSGTRGTP